MDQDFGSYESGECNEEPDVYLEIAKERTDAGFT
jgi:hypothetical protein